LTDSGVTGVSPTELMISARSFPDTDTGESPGNSTGKEPLSTTKRLPGSCVRRIPYFIEDVYNKKCLHFSLDYRPSCELKKMLTINP
jgi:hypothetical protein